MEISIPPDPHEGQIISILDGPLTGFTGRVVKVDIEQRKLAVLVVLYGRETFATIDLLQAQVVQW